jgi:hypothetical protein
MPINESPVLPTLPPKGQPLPTIPMQTPGTAPAAKN